jgi:hypothetical protein|nr:MAG TPA: hypothetical protein [Caudoviricetes sp.]
MSASAERTDPMSFVGNPTIKTTEFTTTYPPLENVDAPYLLNKGNNQLYPNIPELRARSDAYVPYYGEVAVNNASAEVTALNKAIAPTETDESMAAL